MIMPHKSTSAHSAQITDKKTTKRVSILTQQSDVGTYETDRVTKDSSNSSKM